MPLDPPPGETKTSYQRSQPSSDEFAQKIYDSMLETDFPIVAQHEDGSIIHNCEVHGEGILTAGSPADMPLFMREVAKRILTKGGKARVFKFEGEQPPLANQPVLLYFVCEKLDEERVTWTSNIRILQSQS